MKTLHVSVVDKVATYQQRDGYIVCGNTDYEIKFTFDSEWDEFSEKIARFIWNGKATEVKIENGVCPVPKLRNTEKVTVGVRAGDLHTTTPAEIGCKLSILCGDVELTEQDQHYTSVAEEASLAAEASAEEAKVSETNASASAEAAKGYMETAQRVASQSESLQVQITENAERITENAERITENAERIAASSENQQAQITRNSKRITNLEQGLVPYPFETDDSVTYMKDVPANALPYAEIQKIGGMTVKDETTGTLKSAPASEAVSVGANIWDEEWENGYFSSGVYVNSNNCICSVNFIRVEPNTVYFVRISNESNGLSISYYDTNKTYIGNDSAKNSAFTVPDNCRYIKIYTYSTDSAYGKTYSNDICINKYNVAINGEYFPYNKNTLPIPGAVQALDGYGDGVNESVYNYINLEKKQFVKGVGKVNLGTLDWAASSYSRFFASPTNLYSTKTLTEMPTAIMSADYTPSTGQQFNAYEKSYYVSNDGRIAIKDTAYTDAATFKAAMSGVMLYYELATPEVTDITDLITADNFIEVEPNGTLTFENEHRYDVPSTVVYQLKGVSV